MTAKGAGEKITAKDGNRQAGDRARGSSQAQRRVKCVSFAPHEEPLLDYAEGKPGGFSPYVKRLIAADYLAGAAGSRESQPFQMVLSELLLSLGWEQGVMTLGERVSSALGRALVPSAESNQAKRRRDGHMDAEREVELFLQRVLQTAEGDIPSEASLSPEAQAELGQRLAKDPELALQYEARGLDAVGRTLERMARQLGAAAAAYDTGIAFRGFAAALTDIGAMVRLMGEAVGRAGTCRAVTAGPDLATGPELAARVEEGLLTKTLEERAEWFAHLSAQDHLVALTSSHVSTHLLMTLRFGTEVALSALAKLEGEEGFWAAAGVPVAELRALLEQVQERSNPLAHHVQRLLGES